MNKGSAIFIHVAHPNYTPTEGCIAVSCENLIELISDITIKTELDII